MKQRSLFDNIEKKQPEDEQFIEEHQAFNWAKEFPKLCDEEGNFEGFDVVIGNPPYMSFQSDEISKKETDYYADNYKCVYKIYDTFALFIEKGLDLLKKDGHLTYICPSVLLMNNSFSKLRKHIVNSGDILSITECGDGVFEKAVVPTVIFTFEKRKSGNPVKIYSTNDEKFEFKSKLERVGFEAKAESGFNLLLTPQKLIVLRKFENLQRLGDFLEIRETIKTGNDKAFIFNRKRKNSYPVITGKNMNRYSIHQNRYINFDEEKLSRPTKLSYYTQPKLFIRRVGADICAAFDDENLLSTHVLYVGLPKSDTIALKYLLALLNSKLLNWLYNIQFPKKGNVFPEIRIGNLRTMPIVAATVEQQNKIIELVNKIIELKKAASDTSKLEKQVDDIIYKLYGLEKAEIAEIEKFYN